jgi:sigma-B regulation protein RsbU (phosphoserine phosphatase)
MNHETRPNLPDSGDGTPRWRLRLRTKLLVAVNALLLVGLAAGLAWDFQRGLAERLANKQVAMAEEAVLVASAAQALRHHGLSEVQAYIDRACLRMQDASSPGHHIAVRIDDHILQAQTHGRATPAFPEAMQRAHDTSDHQGMVDGHQILVGSHRDNGVVVYVSEFTSNIRQGAKAQLLRRAAVIGLIGVALTAFVNLALLRLVTRPVGRMVGTVRRIGGGELGVTPRRSTTRELDELAVEIGAMSRSLAEADEYRRHQMDKARQIQNHLMPRPDDSEPLGIHHAYIPADDVGGDFFDTKVIDDQRVAFWVGDVTGHGIPAAMSASMLKTLLQYGDADAADPAAVLDQVNRRFHAVTLDGDFATMFMGVIDRRQGKLVYASAGHEIGYLLHRDERIDELGSTGLLLGIDPDAACGSTRLSVQPGDVIVLMTDGLAETMSPDRKLLGRDAIVSALTYRIDAPPRQLIDDLLQLATIHRADQPQLDDITLAVLKV